ncbi:glycoside hydrolase family 68 protein [Fructilactobacillus sp. Tb1]|uniref:glycoside hydrolase family 68 protein n=1 Tax=Fructilactobacillus sp. Tb1 TaxID=3422304 RepID=UPI003D2B5592
MNNFNNNKEHYKMYKSGKHWIYAAITTSVVVAGTAMFSGNVVNADTLSAVSVTGSTVDASTKIAINASSPIAPTADATKVSPAAIQVTKITNENTKTVDTPKADDAVKATDDTKLDKSTDDVKNDDSSNKISDNNLDVKKVEENAAVTANTNTNDTKLDKLTDDVKNDDSSNKISDNNLDVKKVELNASVTTDTNSIDNQADKTDPSAPQNVYVRKGSNVFSDAQSQNIVGTTTDYNVAAVIVKNVINGRVPVVIANRNLEGYISVDDYTSSPQFFNDSYGSSHYTRWDMDQIPEALNNPDYRAPEYDKELLGSNIPSAKVVDPITHEAKEVFVWDSWPLQDPNGQMANYHGYYIVLGLTAVAGTDQNSNAKIGAFAQKIGTKDDGIASWQYLGSIFKTHLDGSNPDDPFLKELVGEWSGSTIMLNPNDDTVRVFYTNAYPVPGGNQQVLTTAQITINAKDGNWDNGLVIDQSKTTDHKSIFAGDGDKYQNLSQLGGAVNGFPDNYCLRDPHYVEANGKKYLVFEGNTGTQDGYQGINNIYNEAYFGGNYDYFMKAHNWLTQFPGSWEYGKAINANAALGIVELNDDFTVKTVMNPLLTANAVNDEFERPDIFEHDGKWYLFTVNRGERMASSTANITGDTHNYMAYMMGFVSEDGIDGHYKPLNGNGLVIASNMHWTDPNFMYSFYVIPPVDKNSDEFVVTSYLGNRSFAPSFLMKMDGDTTKVLSYKVLNQGAVANSDNYYNAEVQANPVFDGASINDGTVISVFGCGPLVVIPPKATPNTPNETPAETVEKVVENTPVDENTPKTPGDNVPTTPVDGNTPKTPGDNVPTTPVDENTPKTPGDNVPTTPVDENTPKTPGDEVPTTPVDENTPKTPGDNVPTTPVDGNTPKTPGDEVPTTPVDENTPKTPGDEVSTTPVDGNTPATPVDNAPVTPTDNTETTTVPADQKTSVPTTTTEEKVPGTSKNDDSTIPTNSTPETTLQNGSETPKAPKDGSNETPKRTDTTHFLNESANLPQTGQDALSSIMAMIGAILLGILGIFGLGKRRN